MRPRRLVANEPDGRTAARTTHRDYTHVVFYWDNRQNPTWHGSLKLAEKAARNPGDSIIEVQETTGRQDEQTGSPRAEKDAQAGEASPDR